MLSTLLFMAMAFLPILVMIAIVAYWQRLRHSDRRRSPLNLTMRE